MSAYMKQFLYILWDASHIWGHMALHTLQSMNVPFRLITAKDITHGLLLSKPPALLLVPGGTASIKARTLGAEGRAAILNYVKAGGKYFGICGGAGFGLSDNEGLGLCPWKRAVYQNRIQHLVSGHVVSKLVSARFTLNKNNNFASLPVWWPGFFEPQEGSDVEIIATYEHADEDLYLADIRLKSLPEHILSHWQELYGVNMGVDFLRMHPGIIGGDYGKGSYVLSYAHLETPNSPEANALFAQMLQTLAGISPENMLSKDWDIEKLPVLWESTSRTQALFEAMKYIQEIMALGRRHRLLFPRNAWLHGWRMGIPGGALNNLYTGIATALSLSPNDNALKFWDEKRESFAQNVQTFWQAAESYLLAERLATTLDTQLPGVVNRHMLTEQKYMLFGKPMHAGGLYQEILDVADELVLRLVQG